MKDTLIIIPVYNEEDNIEYINDASTYSSLKILKEHNLNVITNEKNMGSCETTKVGIKYAYKNKYKFAVFFDSDRQHRAKDIKKLVQAIENGNADMVIGNRYSAQKKTIIEKIGIKVCKIILRRNNYKIIEDVTSGFECINRKVMKSIIENEKILNDINFNLIFLLSKQKMNIIEVPIIMKKRIYGESMFNTIGKRLRYTVKSYKGIKNIKSTDLNKNE